MRLHRSDLDAPGYTRRRSGRGFRYVRPDGRPLTEPGELRRCRDLVIPPAWQDVWICPDPAGHLQAIGTDAAGRRQYLYHPDWRERRDRKKFDHVLEVAQRLPRLRRRVTSDLTSGEWSRARVLALAARLLDRGLFRVGGDQYANGEDPTFGVATLRASHTTVEAGRSTAVTFRYDAKGGIERSVTVRDRTVAAAVRELKGHRRGRARLLAYQGEDGRWRPVRAADINEYLRAASGLDMSAKDLRTWRATVAAAVALARADHPRSATAGKRTVASVMRAVASELGNTPTVARASYVDPRVIEHFLRGDTAAVPPSAPATGPAAEHAVADLLAGD
jgi:DNA topoisomerase IB